MYAEYYKANWWVWLVSGAISVIFGLLFLNYPDQTFKLITLFFGLFALLTGLTFVVGALANRKYTDHFWSTLLFGLVATVIGIATFVPTTNITEAVLLLLVAVYAIIFGFVFVFVGWEIRKEVKGEWLLILSGLFALLLGFYILFNLSTAGSTIAALLGIYLLVKGVIDMVYAFRVRSWKIPETTSY
ncbi:MAG: HdeD family acid-resistance protein [Anaerolineales bacterium]